MGTEGPTQLIKVCVHSRGTWDGTQQPSFEEGGPTVDQAPLPPHIILRGHRRRREETGGDERRQEETRGDRRRPEETGGDQRRQEEETQWSMVGGQAVTLVTF